MCWKKGRWRSQAWWMSTVIYASAAELCCRIVPLNHLNQGRCRCRAFFVEIDAESVLEGEPNHFSVRVKMVYGSYTWGQSQCRIFCCVLAAVKLFSQFSSFRCQIYMVESSRYTKAAKNRLWFSKLQRA